MQRHRERNENDELVIQRGNEKKSTMREKELINKELGISKAEKRKRKSC